MKRTVFFCGFQVFCVCRLVLILSESGRVWWFQVTSCLFRPYFLSVWIVNTFLFCVSVFGLLFWVLLKNTVFALHRCSSRGSSTSF